VTRSAIAGTIVLLFISIAQQARADLTVTVKNDLDIVRPSETIDLKWSDISPALPGAKPDHVIVTGSDGKEVVAQPIWFQPNKKKPADEFVFQSDFAPNETKTFTLAASTPAGSPNATMISPGKMIASRFVSTDQNSRLSSRPAAVWMSGPSVRAA